MLTATADMTLVIEGVAQRFGGRLTIGLPASPYVDFTRALSSVNLTAQMTTDLPDGVRDTAGLSALTGDIVLSGSVDPHGDVTKSAAWLFNPDSIDSPLRHLTVNDCPITYEEGPYVPGSKDPQYLPVSGECWINGYDLDHENGTVTFHVTDLPPEFDTVPSIPSVVTVPPFNAGLTSEFVMDATIRSMYGDSTWPAIRPQCVLAAGFRSSLWPEVGMLDQSFTQPGTTFLPGALGTGLGITEAVVIGSVPRVKYKVTAAPAGSVFVEFWSMVLIGGAATINIGDDARTEGLQFNVSWNSATQTTVSGTASGGTSAHPALTTIPLNSGGHYVAVEFNLPSIGGTTVTGTAYIDGDSAPFSFTLASGRSSTAWDTCYVQVTNIDAAGVEAFQVTTESSPTLSYPFTPRAVLDPSLNPLTVTPPVPADTKGWDLLQTMAAAECGFIRKSRDGTIRFTNRINMLNAEVGRAISKTSLRTFQTSVPPSGAYRRIQVPFTEWEFGDPALIFNLQSRKKIPANSTVVWQQPLTDGALAAAITSPATLLPDTHDPTDGGSYYRSAGDRAGATNGPKLTITITQPSPGSLEITAQNKSTRDAWLTTPGDTYTDFNVAENGHGLWIGGTPVTPGDEATVECVYDDGRGTLQVASNAYLQDHDTAVAVGNFLLAQLFMDIRDFTAVSIVADHRIEISDLDRLVNPDPSGVDEYVIVWGTSYSADFPPAGEDGGSRDMSLDVRALAPPDGWLGGQIPDRAEADESWAYA